MAKFNNDREYIYPYVVFSHENAHTQGFNHSSGLAYGWDDYVSAGIKELFESDDVIPGIVAEESSEIYANYNLKNQSLVLFSNSVQNVDSISAIGDMDTLRFSGVSDNKYLIEMGRKSLSATTFNITYDGDKKFTYIVDDVYGEKIQSERDPYYLKPDEKLSYHFETTGKIIYYIPEQDNVLAHDTASQRSEAVWSGPATPTNITIRIKNTSDGKYYSLDLSAEKGGRHQMHQGAYSSILYISKQEGSYNQLPDGDYTSSFEVVAAGWHNQSYQKSFEVKVEFSKFETEVDRLWLDDWSDNYSKETPSGNSSVYFYVPENDNVISSTGPRKASKAVWSGQAGVTSVVVNVTGEDGKTYPVNLIGNKEFRGLAIKMEDGVQRGYGKLRFKIDTTSDTYNDLPEGMHYRANFNVVAKGWHDTSFSESVLINVEFKK